MEQMMRVCGSEMASPKVRRAIAYMLSLTIALNLLPTNPSKAAHQSTIGGGRAVKALPSNEVKNNILPAASIAAKTVAYVDAMLKNVQHQKRHAEAVKTGQVARQYDIQKAEENLKPVVCDVTNITNISNLSVDNMKRALRGTWLEGKEESLYYFEHKYGINVFFMYAVSTLESDRGDSPLARNRQNYYGANLDRSWKDWTDSTDYFCDFITRLYIDKGHVSVDKIGPIYCPPNPTWANEIKNIMTDLYESVK